MTELERAIETCESDARSLGDSREVLEEQVVRLQNLCRLAADACSVSSAPPSDSDRRHLTELAQRVKKLQRHWTLAMNYQSDLCDRLGISSSEYGGDGQWHTVHASQLGHLG